MKIVPDYIQKLRTTVIDFVKNLEFQNKTTAIAQLQSCAESMKYSAPEVLNSWIEEYFDILNKYLFDIPDDIQSELQEMLKMTDEEKEDYAKIINGDDE